MNKRVLGIGCVVLAGLLARCEPEKEFFFKDNDSVVFLGDSITQQKLYTTYLEAYTLTRFPDNRFRFRNVGWGGDTAWLRKRFKTDEKALFSATGAVLDEMVEKAVRAGLQRDVLPHKPTAVTVKFGMNDHAYQAFREDICRAYVRSKVMCQKNCTLSNVKVRNGTVSFDRLDHALPMPVDARAAAALSLAPVNDELNRYMLKVAGLKAARYALTIDGLHVAEFSRRSLRKE